MAKVASSSTPASRTKRIEKEEEDRISGLPDAVLCHILSFLPTTYGVRTSILSRRWTFLWTSVPVLDFDDELPVGAPMSKRNRKYYETLFTSFVNRVLILHKLQSVKKFCLSLTRFCDSFYVNAWISSAIMRTVDELDLCIMGNEGTVQTLPRSLFISSDKLRVLKLRHNIILNVPDCVCFPSLKVLHLQFLNSLDNDSVGRLFSGSPILEDLIIIRGSSDTLGVLYGHSPSLKTFQFDTGYKTSNPELDVDAPKLEFLKLSGRVSEKWIVRQMPSIVKATIQVSSGCPQTQESDDRAGMTVAEWTNVSISIRILGQTPNLQHLVLRVDQAFLQKKNMWDLPAILPKSLLSSLKVVQFRKFDEHQMQVIEYFLENALVLEKLILAYSGSQTKQLEIVKELLMLPRASSSCRIVWQASY